MNSAMTLDRIDMLKEFGFKYNFDRDIYVNRTKKKIFSLEFIQDHKKEEIQKCLDEINDDWKFYSNKQPSEYVKQVLLQEIA